VQQQVIESELEALVNTLPPRISQLLRQQIDLNDLLEVVLDLGRPAEARFPGREMILSTQEVTQQDIDYVVEHIDSFW